MSQIGWNKIFHERFALAEQQFKRRASACFTLNVSLAKGAIFALLLALAVSGSRSNAYAQDSKQKPDLTEMSLEELMNIEIYSASKYWQRVADAPSSISIVTADEIQKYGYRTLADVLRSVRGFYITYDRNYNYIGARGFGRTGDYNTRVLVLADGHRLNENIYDSVLVGTEFPLDVDLIDRVEVIRGPSSSLYGTNAFFAVVNVVTKRGRQVKGWEVSGEVAGFGTYKGRLSYGRTFRSGLDLLLSGSFYDSAGHRHLFFQEFDDPTTNNGVAVNADDDQYHSFFANLLFRAFTVQGVYVSREKGIPTASYGTAFNDRRTRTRDDRGYLDLQYAHIFENHLEILTCLYYDHYSYDGTYVYNNSGTGNRTLNKDFGWGRWWGAEVTLTRTLADKHKVSLGAEYRHNLRQDQANYDLDPFHHYVDDRRRSKIWALYAQDEVSIRKNLILNAGVRYDHYETFGGTTNPRLGLIYRPFERTTFKFLYGEAFRAPNYYELFYGTGIAEESNPALKPETIKTGELVLERYLGDHYRLAASGFRYKIKGLINQQIDPTSGLLVFRNAEKIEAEGLELEWEGRWASGLAGRVSYSFQGVQDEATGEVLANSPRHLGKANVAVPLIKEKIFAGLELQYMSKRKTLAGTYADGFVVSNVTFFSQKLIKGWDLSASVYNVFNQKYGDPAGEEHRQNIIPQDGRSFRAKLTYRF